MKKRILAFLALIAFFAAMLYIIKPSTFVSTLKSSNKLFLTLAILSEIIAILIRTVRLDVLLGRVNFFKLLKVEIVGLATNEFSPMKSGDAFKAYLIKKNFGIPMSKAMARIMWEEITNFMSYVIVSLWALFFIPKNYRAFFFLASLIFLIPIIYAVEAVYSKNGMKRIARWIGKLVGHKNVELFLSAGKIRKKKFFQAIAIAILMSIADGTTFYLILRSFSVNVSWIYTVSAFCAASIIGSILFILPSGVGSIDGILIALFSFANIKVIMSSVLAFRIISMWFIGLAGLVIYFLSK